MFFRPFRAGTHLCDEIPGDSLPAGMRKKSFRMFFGGGEIWFEHLDGMAHYTELAEKKLAEDFLQFKKPSTPSLLSVNLDETVVSNSLIRALAEKLLSGEKRLTRVAFTGTDKAAQRKLQKALAGAPFALAFINDFEKAKECLVSENPFS